MRASSLSLDDLDTARKHAAKWRDAGYGYLVCGWPDAGRVQVEAFARDVMPDFVELPGQGAAYPPSTTTAEPVVQRDASLARSRTPDQVVGRAESERVASGDGVDRRLREVGVDGRANVPGTRS